MSFNNIEQASLAEVFSFPTSLAISLSTGFACKVPLIIIIFSNHHDVLICIQALPERFLM